MLTRVIRTIGCVLLLSLAAFPAFADNWPSRPIKLVVPYPPGGSTDVTARVIAENLRPLLGQSVVVDNRPGAGGNIGAEAVAKSAPDGYTLLMATSTHVTNMSLYQSMPYDFVRDLAPVAQITFIPNVLVVGASLPVNNLAEFIAYVKSGKVRALGTSGAKRATSLLDVPTVAESGVPEFVVLNWQGILVQRKTPLSIIQKLHGDLVKAMSLSEMRENMNSQGLESGTSSPGQFGELIGSEIDKYRKVVTAAGIKVD